MANTEVTLINSGGIYVPSVPSVSVVNGDTVSFSTSDGSAALAFFSPDAISILSPKPTNPLPIGSNGKTVFSFASSMPGSYSVFFGADRSAAPARFPGAVSQQLLLEIQAPVAPSFGNPMATGHGG